jgi:hypothetical protein
VLVVVGLAAPVAEHPAAMTRTVAAPRRTLMVRSSTQSFPCCRFIASTFACSVRTCSANAAFIFLM